MLILKSLGLGLVTMLLVSSAYRNSVAFLFVVFRHIVYIENNGPKIELRETPCLRFFHPEEVLL
jgi:hypothetical protein